MKRLLIASLMLMPVCAFAEPSERAVEIAQKYIIVDGHIDAPTTIIEDGADIASGAKTLEFDYERAQAGWSRCAVYVDLCGG